MSSRASFHDVYWYVFWGLLWLVLAIESDSLQWAIIGGMSASGLTLAVTRKWTNALAAGAVVTAIISAFGISASVQSWLVQGCVIAMRSCGGERLSRPGVQRRPCGIEAGRWYS